MQHAVAAHGDRSSLGRLAVFGVLALGEILLVSYAFNFPTGIPEWMNPVTYAKVAAQFAVVAAAVLLLVAWPTRDTVVEAWNSAMQRYNWRASVVRNLALFAVLLAATVAWSSFATQAAAAKALTGRLIEVQLPGIHAGACGQQVGRPLDESAGNGPFVDHLFRASFV